MQTHHLKALLGFLNVTEYWRKNNNNSSSRKMSKGNMEDEREMEEIETRLLSFVILPDSKQTYKLKTEILWHM